MSENVSTASEIVIVAVESITAFAAEPSWGHAANAPLSRRHEAASEDHAPSASPAHV